MHCTRQLEAHTCSIPCRLRWMKESSRARFDVLRHKIWLAINVEPTRPVAEGGLGTLQQAGQLFLKNDSCS